MKRRGGSELTGVRGKDKSRERPGGVKGFYGKTTFNAATIGTWIQLDDEA